MEKSEKAGSGYQLRNMRPEEVKLKKIRMYKLGGEFPPPPWTVRLTVHGGMRKSRFRGETTAHIWVHYFIMSHFSQF